MNIKKNDPRDRDEYSEAEANRILESDNISELEKKAESELKKIESGELDIPLGWFRQIFPYTVAPSYIANGKKVLVDESDVKAAELEVYNLLERVLGVLRDKAEEPIVRCLRAENEILKFKVARRSEIKKESE
jgi:hypothetical protein